MRKPSLRAGKRLLAVMVVGAAGALVLAVASATNPPGAPADHFLSYKAKPAKGSGSFAPVVALRLVDRFEGGERFDAIQARELLVPAEIGGAGPNDAATHLQAYAIKASKVCSDDGRPCGKGLACDAGAKCKRPAHAKRLGEPMLDPFGARAIDVLKPDTLLVPSGKSLTDVPLAPDPASHAVDHFKCYKAKIAGGSAGLPKGTVVTIADQLTSPAKRIDLGALTHLCTPVETNGEPVESATGHLLCYKAKPAKGEPKHAKRVGIGVANQLGTLRRDTVAESVLCVPAVPVVSVPTPGGQATVTASGPTPTPTGATRTSTPGGGAPTPTAVGTPTVAAPPVANNAGTTLSDASAFLYVGPNAIQIGVVPGTIDPARAAVVRGLVLDANGAPLPGVTITILRHPEFGHTTSRADGMFDMAVNGGTTLTVDYVKAGLLPGQRSITVPAQDYTRLPDVMLLPLDAAMTTVDLTANDPMQVARGTMMADADGARQATLLIPQGTAAEMVMPNGSTQPVSTLSIRATEYTVGGNGPKAMPGELPPASGFTYAFELSTDEALAAGAASVRFNQPLPFYVENFVGFPVGSLVPTGYYDRIAGHWVPSDNGLVIAVLGATGGLADLDLDGNGTADDATALAAVGITDAERQRLVTMYGPGQELWRVPIPHFTAWDHNWPYGPCDTCDPPGGGGGGGDDGDCDDGACPGPDHDDPPRDGDNDCQRPGSVIECQTQALGESIAIAGTRYELVYRSNRSRGYARTLNVRLTGATVNPLLQAVELEVRVAGRLFTQSFAPTPNLIFPFVWDGRDAYDRPLQGRQPVAVRIGYEYLGQYFATASSFDASFNRFGSAPITLARGGGGGGGGGGGVVFSGVPLRNVAPTVVLWREYTAKLGTADARAQGFGGWTLDVHHAYDLAGGDLYLGNGRVRRTEVLGAVRRPAAVGSPNALALSIGPDESLYFADSDRRSVYHVLSDGTEERVIGTGGLTNGDPADGVAATNAELPNLLPGLAVAPDGRIFVTSGNRVRVVENGIIRTYAGGVEQCATPPSCGDGGQATLARFGRPWGLALAPDGSLYVADQLLARVRRIAPDGNITTVAGNGTFGSCAAVSGFATSAPIPGPSGLAIAADGTLYIQSFGCGQKLRVGSDGRVSPLTGAGFGDPANSEGMPASQIGPLYDYGFAVDREGAVYFSGTRRIHRIGTDGLFTTIVGNGVPCPIDGPACDLGGPSRSARLNAVRAIAVTPSGRLVYFDQRLTPSIVSSGSPSTPPLDAAFSIPSEDGRELYGFDAQGRHLATLDTLTGTVIRQFTYDGAQRLISITEHGANTTTVERNGGGDATAIVGPDGQRTGLTIGASGDLARVENPLGQAFDLTYHGGAGAGLLATTTDPRGMVHRYTYDASGRLVQDAAPANALSTLVRTRASEDDYTVAVTTADGPTVDYRVEDLPDGSERLRVGSPGGPQRQLVTEKSLRSTLTVADGTIRVDQVGPDPRFGMQSPITTSRTFTTPGGRVRTATTSRTASLADAGDPLSLTVLSDSLVVNGRTWTRSYDAAQRRFTLTTPTGRQRQVTLNAQGRLAQIAIPSLTPLTFTDDARSRRAALSFGARTTSFAYGSDGFVSTMTAATGDAIGFTWDAAGGLASLTRPDASVVGFTRDARGKITALTPPGRTPHLFSYTDAGRLARVTPPDLGPGDESTDYTYDRDGRLVSIAMPDTTIDVDYDALGRVDFVSVPGDSIDPSYDTAGRVATVATSASVGLAYQYDGRLLLATTWTGPVTGQVSRTYDSDFRTTQRTVNGGHTIARTYDSDGILSQAGVLTVARDTTTGLVSGTTLGSLTDVIGRNAFGESVAYDAAFDGTPLYAFDLTLDTIGRIASVSETIAGTTHTAEYGYDALGRLEDVVRDGVGTASYSYDAVGNRLTGPGAGGAFTYDAQERLLARGGTTYTYAANGALASTTAGGITTTYVVDALGRLRSATRPGTAITYVIDGAGRRIGKRVNGTLVQGFLYQDGLRPIAELDGADAVVSVFVYATRPNVPDYFIKQGVTYRILADHLGSPRLVVRTSDGVVVQRMDYDEFGRVVGDTNAGFQPFGFAGGLYDGATGLVRFGAREYDPESGRWISKDPSGFRGGINPYVYVENDPINWIDSRGRNGTLALGAGGALGFGAGSGIGGAALGGALAIGGGAVAAAAFGVGAVYAVVVAAPEIIDNIGGIVEENADTTHDDEGSEEGGAPDTTPDGGSCPTRPAPQETDKAPPPDDEVTDDFLQNPTFPNDRDRRTPRIPYPETPEDGFDDPSLDAPFRL